MPGTPLVAWLRDRNDHALAALLHARPDLATPPPADFTVLATRAGARASVARACENLDTCTLAVLEALLVLDADVEPVQLLPVARLLGRGITVTRTRQALDVLRTLALAWGPDDAVSVVPAVRDVLPPFPGGLGRPSPPLDELDLPEVLEELDPAERAVLEKLAAGPPIGRTRDAGRVVPLERATTPVQRLLARGLLLRRDAETVELPRQVAFVLRGDQPLGPVRLDPPELDTTEPGKDAVDTTGAGAALELVRHAEGLLGLWSTEPPPVLRSGGLGIRELRRAAKELEVDEQQAALLVELLVAAELVAPCEGPEPEWVPTTHADGWLAGTPAQRWGTLATAWLDMPRLPGLIGRRDERERLLVLLSDDLRWPPAPGERRRILRALAELPPGTGVTGAATLAELLAWQAPRRGGRLRDELVEWTLSEGTTVGVLALGALTSAGRELLADGPDASAEAVRRMASVMPEPVDHVLVQADLTVVAPGPLEPELAEEMSLVADVESAGSATVYRVSEASVRRALDAGRTATDLHELFRRRSRTPVPQGLTYLIDDVARRHGRLRGGSAGSFLRCDDPLVLTEVLASPMAAKLELRRIADTVLISPLPLADVLEGLRGAGFSPTAEGPDGQVLDLRPAGRRTQPRARDQHQAPLPTPASPEQLRTVVNQIRAGDRAASVRRGATVSSGSGDTRAALHLLRHAIQHRRSVWLGFVDSYGVGAQHIVEPISITGGMLNCFDTVEGGLRAFPVHRITSVALVEDNAASDDSPRNR
ncbi:MAG TPA: helicase-associated domain-containing protein [Pseudonocardiaceae bacterium]